MKSAIGLCTFGLLDFSRLAVRSIYETYTGKPEDLATVGFPAACIEFWRFLQQ